MGKFNKLIAKKTNTAPTMDFHGPMSSPPPQGMTPEDLHELHQMPVLSPIRPAVTPLQMAGFDPLPDIQVNPCITSYQFKNVAIFCGSSKQGPRVEDWARDMRHLLQVKGASTPDVVLSDIIRHTSGRARDLVLNLNARIDGTPTSETIFNELLEEYGESNLTVDPMAAFYARVQHPNETPSDFAIALEALLRRANTGGECWDNVKADRTLSTQFMCGLRDQAVRDRLAPMRPRNMPYKELRRELRLISEETRQTHVGLLRHDVKPKAEEQDRMQDFLESMRCQLAQIQHAQQQQLETIHRLADGHGQLGNRLGALEGFVSAPRMPAPGMPAPGIPAPGMPPTDMHPPSAQNTRRKPLTCYTCGELGHMSNRCPTRSRSNSRHGNGLNM